jgi:excisionase family DNA binding protein
MIDKYFTVLEMSELLKIHYVTIQRLCREHKIPAFKWRNTWLCNKTDFISFRGTYIPYPGRKGKSINRLL